ncbi:MAG: ArnT family glycosyltransferase [Prevotella sp.]|jgi:4-amino-4-deoxy-L-arabinose transferase-like glycosyltransferase
MTQGFYSNAKRPLRKTSVILLIVLGLFTFFVNLEQLPSDIMEMRNLVTAREIVHDGNWLVPTMNGELRLQKPPLPTWVAGAVETVSPDNLGLQRAAAGVMGSLWVLFLFLTVRKLSKDDDLPVVTAVVFMTCYNLVLMGRSATWDIYCHSWMMGAIYFLTCGLLEQRREWLHFMVAGLLLGLSFLSKGPVSFYALLLPYLLVFGFMARPRLKGKWAPIAVMILLMLVVGGWWYVYLLVKHPAEMSQVIHVETGAWSNHNVRPWYYYWQFFLEMGAWAVLMLAALAYPYWVKRLKLSREYILSFGWAIGVLVLLSLMPEKKTRYLLPMLAPSAMLVACLVVHFKQGVVMDRFSKFLFRFNGAVIALVVLTVVGLLFFYVLPRHMLSQGTAIVVSILLLGILVWIVRAVHDYRPMKFIGGIASIFVVAEVFLLSAIGNVFGNPDAHSISLINQDKRMDGISLYYPEQEALRIEMVYQAHRKILPLAVEDSVALSRVLPCAIVSQKPIAEVVPATVLAGVDTVSIGFFDDNKHPKTDKHYSDVFLNHVTLLTTKK